MNDTQKPWDHPDFDDNPEWTEADFARAKPASAFPELAGVPLTKRGRPVGYRKPDAKKSITLRLDPDVLEGWRSTGPGWQSRMNDALRSMLVAASR